MLHQSLGTSVTRYSVRNFIAWSFSCVLTFQLSHFATTRSGALIPSFAGPDTPSPSKVAELPGPPALVSSCTRLICYQNRDCVTSQIQRLCAAGSKPQHAFCSTPQSNKFPRPVVWARILHLESAGRTILQRGLLGRCCPWAGRALNFGLWILGCSGLCHLDSAVLNFKVGWCSFPGRLAKSSVDRGAPFIFVWFVFAH